MFNPFVKPEIRHIQQEGYPPYPYVAHAYTLFNMLFRDKQVTAMQRTCNAEIVNLEKEIFSGKVRAIVQEELAKAK